MSDKMREAFEQAFDSALSMCPEQFDGDLTASQCHYIAEQVWKAALSQQPESEPNEYWVLFDAEADKKYIKKSQADGSLAFFDTEKEVRRARSIHPGTDYKRVLYYTSPQPSAQVPEDLLPRVKNLLLSLGHQGEQLNPDEPPYDVGGWGIREAQELYTQLSAAPSIAEKREWISCEERLPSESDADFRGNIWAFRPDRGVPIMIDPVNVGLFPFTHWMPTGLQRPEPPEVPE